MTGKTPTARFAESLLAGPRGRRFLLEFALAAELAQNPARQPGTFGFAAMRATQQNSQGHERSLIEAANLLIDLELEEPPELLLRTALAAAVGNARYWQAPDGADALAATTVIQAGLTRIAEHVARSHRTKWWSDAVLVDGQYAVSWQGDREAAASESVSRILFEASEAERAAELVAQKRRVDDPASRWSGDWWSRPAEAVPSSTRLLTDDTPADLWFVEDDGGRELAESVQVMVPKGAAVYELAAASDWAELCRKFPLEVTAQKQDDWQRTTGRTGRWVVPDWSQVAEHYDGVHLQVGAYLSAAGTAIPVHCGGEDTAGVIAGWNPDQTYWFTPDLGYGEVRTRWALRNEGTGISWEQYEIETREG